MNAESTWLDSIPADEVEQVLSSDLCTDEIFYVDLETHEELFTKDVTNLTSRTK